MADFWGANSTKLTDILYIEAALRAAASSANAHVLSCQLHQFPSSEKTLNGVTGVLLLAESHLSIHTWPEHGMAAIDIYLCGATDAKAALAKLQEWFEPTKQVVHTQKRGLSD